MRRSLCFALSIACALTLFLACFWPVLARGEQFGYRDAGHYYYPLYQRVQQEWAKGRLPLWDARENAGMPLLGNPTAAVLYPGKLIYAALPYPWAARVYILAHVVLAWAGMYRLMRGWSTSQAGSAIAAMSYAFGAPVLFQYCNIIFLVGAAWVPFGIAAIDRWLRTGHRASIGVLALVLAMQTLGGDPEAAYVTGLCAGGYALGLAVARRREASGRPPIPTILVVTGTIVILSVWCAIVLGCARILPGWRPSGPPAGPLPWSRAWPSIMAAVWGLIAFCWLVSRKSRRGPLAARLGGLALAAGLAGVACAAQLFPVMEFASKTSRAAPDGPHDIYPFAVEPYRLAETIWPQVFGSNGRVNSSWGVLIPPQHRTNVWVPSLYMGGLTLILALSAMGLRGSGARRVWLSWIAVLSLLASLGEYAGPLWIARCVPAIARFVGPHDPMDTGAIRADLKLRDGDGSVYGLMAWGLPGFGGFRYPAKLMTFTCLAVSGLAGIGLDRLLAGRSRRALIPAVGLAITGAILLVLVQVGRTQIVAWLIAARGLKGMSLYGPMAPEAAWGDCRGALLHGTSLLAASVALIVAARRFPRSAAVLAVVIVTADLWAANARLVLTVPQSLFEEQPEVLKRIAEAEAADPSPGPFRVHRMPMWDPRGFYFASSPDRERELVAWERKTLQPKYGIPLGLSYTLTEGVADLYDYSWFFAPFYVDYVPQGTTRPASEPTPLIYFPRRGFDLWATRYFIVPAIGTNEERRAHFSFLFDVEQISRRKEGMTAAAAAQFDENWKTAEDWHLYKNKHPSPRCWIVHQAEFRAPIRGFSRQSREQRQSLIESLVYGGDFLWNRPNRQVQDLRSKAFIEIEEQGDLFKSLSFRGTDPSETAEIVADDDPRVVIEVQLKSPGIVVLADVFYPGWELYVDDKPATIYQVNRLMRGALVGEGTHRLVYIYNPQSTRLGIAVSASGMILLAGFFLRCRSRPRSVLLSETF